MLDENTPDTSGLVSSGDMKQVVKRTARGLAPSWLLRWRAVGPPVLRCLAVAAIAIMGEAVLFALLFGLDSRGLVYEGGLGNLVNGAAQAPTQTQTQTAEAFANSQTPSFAGRFLFALCVALSGSPAGSGVVVVVYHHPFAWFFFYAMSLVGLLTRLLLTMALFGVVTRSPVHVVFSRWCVISNRSLTGLRSLEFRILNEFGFERELLEAEVSVTLSITPSRNPTKRRFHELHLLRSRQPIMPVRVSATCA